VAPRAKKSAFHPLYSEGCVARLSGTAEAGDARSEYRRDYGRLIHSASFRRLQGKTQLFPGSESDFFRNRLTHSFEVAQVAKGIALQLNQQPFFKNRPIDTDLVELAGLAHDLGHPPFGHNGERALDDCMKGFGGFEGNAQTLRILTHLERKVFGSGDHDDYGMSTGGKDRRLGLDLSFRSLASVLKYDRPIPTVRAKKDKLVKGYYQEERSTVEQIKAALGVPSIAMGDFKTIECQIMDVADDIAYSTYDLEDSFKAGFLSPLSMLAENQEVLEAVAKTVNEADELDRKIGPADVLEVLHGIFSRSLGEETADDDPPIVSATLIYRTSKKIAENGHYRTAFTSDLVKSNIDGVQLYDTNEEHPMLSGVRLNDETRLRVEVLKRYTYHAITMSPRLRLVEYRGYDIVRTIFKALAGDSGHHLFPDDYRRMYQRLSDQQARYRLICDYVASMTDRYAVEFYARIQSVNPQTIFKPH
jgi:dGTPase